MSHRTFPIMALPNLGALFEFISAINDTVHVLLVELAILLIFVVPQWDVVIDKSRFSTLHCDDITAGLGATREPHCLY